MAIRVFIKRKFEERQEKELMALIHELRTISTTQPGYVSGETLKRIDVGGQSLVISKWKSMGYWQAWQDTPQRTDIQKKIDALLTAKTEYEIYDFG